jgi:ATP-dependent RNA helicase DeaD
MRNIEQLTKSRIDVATVPTVADLRAKRLERIRTSIQEVLEAGGLNRFRVVAESLAEQFDPVDVAAAAVKLADRSHGGERVEDEIPAVQRCGDEASRPRRESGERARGATTRDREGRPFGRHEGARQSAGIVKLYIGAGRTTGIGPGDLVGAIANEAKVNSNVIGAIDMTDRFSLVDVPKELARGIIEALGRTRIKGQKVAVRLFHEKEKT